MVARALCCWIRAFSSCHKWRKLSRCSVWAQHSQRTGSRAHRLSNCGPQASLPHSIWNLPRPGIEPVPPALANRVLTTGPPENSPFATINRNVKQCSHHERVWWFLKKLKIKFLYGPPTLHLEHAQKNWKHGLEEIFVHPCSERHYSQKPNGGSNSKVHW